MTPIVVVAFNRARSLQRLLESINKAEYPSTDIPLIISIDKGDNADVLDVANRFQWRHGTKEVRYQPENLKLRKHILKCGDLSQEYGSVIILEDDLYVSPCFYRYTMQALEFSKNDDRIGGISLYAHAYNVNTFEPFSPFLDGFDNWYFQFASSWGEAWTKEQWSSFRKWYSENEGKNLAAPNMPRTVSNWSPNSWLKYFIKYLIETDRFFLYPRASLTTNFCAAGTHIKSESTTFQVPLCRNQKSFHFSGLDESEAVYDAFFENQKIKEWLHCQDLEVDLYGSKPQETEKRYLLSCNMYHYKMLNSFSRSLRPADANIYFSIPGDDFFLYDRTVRETNQTVVDKQKRLRYNIRVFKREAYPQIANMFIHEVYQKLLAMKRK